MVCRYYRVGSAITSYARITNGLGDRQLMSMYHDLQREGADYPAPTREQQNTMLDQIEREVRADTRLSPARRASILRRLASARDQNMSGPVYFATMSINERAVQARQALDAYTETAARELGMTQDQVNRLLREQVDTAIDNGRQDRANSAFADDFRNRPQNSSLPMDRATMRAYEHIEGLRAARRSSAPSRPTVVRQPVNSSAIASMGYDPNTGRVEVELTSRPGVPYAYRMTREQYDDFRSAPSLGRYYSRYVRGNSMFQWETSAAQEASAAAIQCATCGQFASPSEPHACPVRDSAEERNRTIRVARATLLGREAELAPASQRFDSGAATRNYVTSIQGEHNLPACIVCQGPATRQVPLDGGAYGWAYMCDTNHNSRSLTVAASGPEFMHINTDPIVGDFGRARVLDRADLDSDQSSGVSGQVSMRTIPLSDVTVAARSHGAGNSVSVPLDSNVVALADADGTISRGRVTGRVNVSYLGHGRGYSVEAVTEPGDSERDHLRCDCADYRTRYDCVHVRNTVADLSNRLNSSSPNRPEAVAEARQVVAERVALEGFASREAQATAVAAARAAEPEVMLSEDMATFQEWYNEAKVEWESGEVPGEYMTEDALGGDPNTTFGVEIEFEIAPGVNKHTALANIGRELHALGLTPVARQEDYGTRKRFRGYTTEHRGGWSFETDCTVSGEVITPIMRDTPEAWENLRKVCEVLRRNGAIPHESAGSHVHVGTAEFDHTIGNYNRMGGIIDEHADVLKRLATNPERGTHRNGIYSRYSAWPNSGYRDFASMRNSRSNSGHNTAYNFEAVSGSASDNVEMRVWDSSLDEKVIQTQIILSVGVKRKAFEDPDYQPGAPTPPGTHRQASRQLRGTARRLSGEAWKESTSHFRSFVDKIATGTAQKRAIVNLFAITKWQS